MSNVSNVPEMITELQVMQLKRILPEGLAIDRLSRDEASRLITLHDPNAKWRKSHPTEWQKSFLIGRSKWHEKMTRGEAADLIGVIKKEESGLSSAEYYNTQRQSSQRY